MASNLEGFAWTGSNFKHERPSRVDTRAERKAAKEANWRKVCKQVDARDHQRCRACGEWCNPDGLNLLDRGHRHHLTFRSAGGQDVASNLVLLCARCHDAIHVKRTLRLEPTNSHGADGALEVWRFTEESGWFISRRESACGVVERD